MEPTQPVSYVCGGAQFCGGEKGANDGGKETETTGRRDSSNGGLRTRSVQLTCSLRKTAVTKPCFAQETPSCVASVGIVFYTKRGHPEVSTNDGATAHHFGKFRFPNRLANFKLV